MYPFLISSCYLSTNHLWKPSCSTWLLSTFLLVYRAPHNSPDNTNVQLCDYRYLINCSRCSKGIFPAVISFYWLRSSLINMSSTRYLCHPPHQCIISTSPCRFILPPALSAAGLWREHLSVALMHPHHLWQITATTLGQTFLLHQHEANKSKPWALNFPSTTVLPKGMFI